MNPQFISFDPGFKEAFAEGAIDNADLVQKIREMGIEVIE